MVLWIGFDLQAEIEALDVSNWTALHFAAYYGKEAVATQLLQAVASVSAVTDGGQTPLHYAAYNDKSSIANMLLQANASPTAVNNDGDTPAQFAKQRATATSRRCCWRQSKPQPLSESGIRWSPFHFIGRETFLNPLCGAVDWF